MWSVLIWFGFLDTSPTVKPLAAPPLRPESGYASACYSIEKVGHLNCGEEETGYWAFYPERKDIKSAPVIIFLHGYGAINPLCYGAWIDHLVKSGNIVIYPRYQQSILVTPTEKFVMNSAIAIRNALNDIPKATGIIPDTTNTIYVGHSYGGAISANIAATFESLHLPSPRGVMLCQPGTAFLKGALLDSYSNIPAYTKLISIVGEDDKVVQDVLGKKVYKTATNTPNRNLVRHFADHVGDPLISAEHREPYAVNMDYDKNYRNVTVWKTIKYSKVNSVDYYCYWKLLDALQQCVRASDECNICFGNTPEQRFMGKWSDGTPVRELEITTPVYN
ncbi:MAG: hypothetical protein KA010_02010 [Saprospiraceae bacterium]|nr:hypothetical protein [Saprospiraceae bacterium]